MTKCLNCTNEFVYKRSTAKFCSGACRLKYHRSVSNKGLSVSEKPLSVTKLEEKVETLKPKEIRKSKNPPFAICPKHKVFFYSCKC